MKLAVVGGAPPSLSMDRMMKLSSLLEDALEDADQEVLSWELLEEVADERGLEVSHLLAATTLGEFRFEGGAPVTFIACAGGCQSKGALPLLQQLTRHRAARAEAGQSVFNIEVRSCLDKCDAGPVVFARGPDGQAVITNASAQALTDAVDSLCNE